MNSSPATFSDAALATSGVVAEMLDTDRQIAALQARQLALLGRAGAIAAEQTARIPIGAQREREMPLRSIAAEIGAALRRSDRGMQNRIHEATSMLAQFPSTVQSLREGRIDIAHLRVIGEAGSRLTDPEARAIFEQAALAVAERETAARAKPIITMLAHRIDPVPSADRHATAAAGRRVWVRDLDDGMAEVVALLPAPLAHGIRDRVTRYARTLLDQANSGDPAGGHDSAPADTRTVDQRRADVFTDLLLTGHASAAASDDTICETDAIAARIQLTVPSATLAGREVPASLQGHGPIDAASARHYASTATSWDRLFVDAATGNVEDADRYRPSRAQRRLLRGRDEHCRFPGCRAAVWVCDIDHTIDFARGGPTRPCNLAHLCKRHHTLKHHTAWSVEQRPDGMLVWTSPTGRVYSDIPQRVLEFSAATRSGAPPPF
ncbi:HNH endonuclease signature motif containing protein [Microbacterium sp. zg.Y909]|uniref:HNH endonuclease signature motif containing protein n=1 Tax=Microbacterium sp. zg.Y909 TaxID=2969413 RepID=UPI00214C83D3|nr:HNH endonuclease signature motif containing protein [Microbacterium sp. zg.Y909]MCR2825085.1 HNH endonuclease [Microbacterium sp. zg.Y909]